MGFVVLYFIAALGVSAALGVLEDKSIKRIASIFLWVVGGGVFLGLLVWWGCLCV